MEKNETKKNIIPETPEYYKQLIENTQIAENSDFLQKSEYNDKYNGSRLYNKEISETYVSKKAGDESDYWSAGKLCYDDPILKKNIVYLTNNRESYCFKELPKQFENKEMNRTVTRISEYSNALYNNAVFKNPRFISC
jgi:hypothetical protein